MLASPLNRYKERWTSGHSVYRAIIALRGNKTEHHTVISVWEIITPNYSTFITAIGKLITILKRSYSYS